MHEVITSEGEVGEAGAFTSLGVRPAFCLSRDTEVVKDETIVSGRSVYRLK